MCERLRREFSSGAGISKIRARQSVRLCLVLTLGWTDERRRRSCERHWCSGKKCYSCTRQPGQPWVCCESMSMREPSTVQCIACTVRARAVQFITTRPYCTVRAPATAPIHVMSHIQYVRRHCRDRGSPRSPVPPSRRPRLAAPGAPERAVRAAASHHTHTARARPRQPHAARTCANAGGALVSLPLSRARYAAARALLTCSSRASSSRAADHG